MDTFEKELRKIQRRDWQIWILTLTVFLILTTFIVLVIFYSDLQRLYEDQIDAQMFNFLLLGFVALSLFFIGYVVIKEIALKKLHRDLIAQSMDSQLLERKVTELQALQELTSVVNSEMMLSEVFDTITTKALSTLGGDQCSLFLYDPEIDKLRCVSVWGPKSDQVRDATVEVGKSVAGWVIEHGDPLFLSGDLKDGQFREVVKKDNKITSSLCLPLKIKDEAKGVLNISMLEEGKAFTQSDLKLAAKFAEQAAVAIEKAGLYEKLKKQTKTLKNIIKEMNATQSRSIEPDTIRALSNLASGMAHDFTRTLSDILEKTSLIEQRLQKISIPEEKERKEIWDWLKAIEQLAGEGLETAKNVQTFARTFQLGSEKDAEELNVNALVKEVVGFTRSRWEEESNPEGKGISMQTELGEVFPVMGNPTEIKDVLTSMIYNSIDAMPEGGKIGIRTEMQGGQVKIEVKDNGAGMSQEVKRKVFEPFFTTKRERGRGIGLSVAQGIISRHNGEITVESEPGEGTTFTIILPIKDESTIETERTAESVSRTETATPAL
jgi:signal transduction histidine kinase